MELTNWLLVIVGLISLALTVMVPLIAHLYGTVHKTSKELSDHKTHVAEYYSPKAEVEKLGERIERQMKNGFDNLKELLNNRRDKDAA